MRNMFRNETECSFVGRITPISWDKNGRVKKFSLYTDTEEDIILESHRSRRKLRKYLKKNVIATGRLKLRPDGVKVLKLTGIKSLSDGRPKMAKSFIPEYSLSLPERLELDFAS